MTSRIFSAATVGFDGHLIEVESDASVGLPSLSIVGLGGKAVMEARERVRSAITNSGFSFPARRITINLAPANLPKSGTHFDLPIALSILVVSGQLRPEDVAGTMFAGELALDGSLRPIKGAVYVSELARSARMRRLVIPAANTRQARMIDAGPEVIGLASLLEVFRYLKGLYRPDPLDEKIATDSVSRGPVIDEVYGQAQAKRAIAIAAAGHHNILLTGPPGTGKTLLARVLNNLLPPLSNDEKIATTKLYSLTDEISDEIITTRPFRSPHHTASRTSLIGGGNNPAPGEVSLAHLGVLFLDELPEYPHAVLESLRQPLEDKAITVTRTHGSVRFPADFMLVATRNPCPCGYYGDPTHECSCSPSALSAYAHRLSGPLLDRIDLTVTVARVPHNTLLSQTVTVGAPEHQRLQQSIAEARQRQSDRYGDGRTNASLSSHELKTAINLEMPARELLLTAAAKLELSARATFKVLRVARTIADLDASDSVTMSHVSEALQYRSGS